MISELIGGENGSPSIIGDPLPGLDDNVATTELPDLFLRGLGLFVYRQRGVPATQILFRTRRVRSRVDVKFGNPDQCDRTERS